jgi:hypothetical protein
MATTTNYSWTTPDDTALVKDGAAAIRSLGTAIDTTVFNNAGASIAKTIVDAKGDIIAATAADTVARLAVGANNTVLTADSSTATGLKWATPTSGGMTLLSTTTLSGTSTVISSIDQSYNNLQIIITGVTSSTNNKYLTLNPGSTDSIGVDSPGSSSGQMFSFQNSSIFLSGQQGLSNSDANNTWVVNFFRYASTSTYKTYSMIGGCTTNTPADYKLFSNGYVKSNSAISSITIGSEGGNTFSTGTVLVYGVK